MKKHPISQSRKKPKHFQLMNYIIEFCAYVIHFIPYKMWIRAGNLTGMLSYYLDKRHRRIVIRNLRFIYGNSFSSEKIIALAKETFKHYGMIYHEWLFLPWMDKDQLSKLVTYEGEEHLKRAKQKGSNVILLSAHYGNWEFAQFYYGSFFNKLCFVVRKWKNTPLENAWQDISNRFNRHLIYKDDFRKVLKQIRSGNDLVIFSDHKANPYEGFISTFFGKRTFSYGIVPDLAQRLKLPVIPMFITRYNTFYHKITFLPELTFEKAEEAHASFKNAQHVNDCIEPVIRKKPEEWLWFHRRWKYFFPELYKKGNRIVNGDTVQEILPENAFIHSINPQQNR